MKIGPDNYQEWALDYIEGNLSREERASFESFLTRHADIAREIASLQDDMPVMVAEQIVYPDKRSLLRGGKTMSFGRITSFLGGAAAASLLIGLFTLVDSHSSQKSFRPNRTNGPLRKARAAAKRNKTSRNWPPPYRNEPRPATASPSGPTSRQRPGRTPRPYSPSAFSRCRS